MSDSTPPVKVSIPARLITAIVTSVLSSAGTYGVVQFAKPEAAGQAETRERVIKIEAQLQAMQASQAQILERLNRGDDQRLTDAYLSGLRAGKVQP